MARVIVGVVLLVLGIVFTFAMDTGRIWYGAIIAGVVMIFRGLAQGSAEPPRHREPRFLPTEGQPPGGPDSDDRRAA